MLLLFFYCQLCLYMLLFLFYTAGIAITTAQIRKLINVCITQNTHTINKTDLILIWQLIKAISMPHFFSYGTVTSNVSHV